METKFHPTNDDAATKHDEELRKSGMPPGMGSRAVADLTKHALARIDTVMEDTIALVDEPFDRFKLLGAIAASCLNRFGNGPLDEVLPKGLLSFGNESKRRHAIVDCINAISIEPDKLSQREKAIGLILHTCLRARAKNQDVTEAIIETLLRS